MKKQTKRNWQIAGGIVMAVAIAGISAYIISKNSKRATKKGKRKSKKTE